MVRRYLVECSRLVRSGVATDEVSHYPAINALLSELGTLSNPRRTTVPNPAAVGGALPDVAIYERESGVLVLPGEVKGRGISLDNILGSEQARRYARVFGGGRILVTNVWGFAWGELNGEGDAY